MRALLVLFLVFLSFADPFDRALRKGGYVFIYFYSPTCSFCMRCSAFLYQNRHKLVRSELLAVDIEKEPDLAERSGITSVPVILMVDPSANKVVGVFSGLRQCYQVVNYFN